MFFVEKSSLSSGSGQLGCFVVFSLLYSKLYILYIPYSVTFFTLIEDSKKGLFVGCNNIYHVGNVKEAIFTMLIKRVM